MMGMTYKFGESVSESRGNDDESAGEDDDGKQPKGEKGEKGEKGYRRKARKLVDTVTGTGKVSKGAGVRRRH